ncbi:SGNH/GDSL hydrolase family protein [Paenibacillus sp. XY044]|uniref:SGNH/GDSL hydrolase family protein n=1 Tax=Paenibacillus sp. XY044 TaxID=2026089 RepID=UPI000B97F532|nr:SGNH/GDSL hydrolase family protein [Paenibacillus sp. XY044]OZB94453.1 G-D-S-L family lipolytic protein [Paenibacillus sp. XY044]
MSDSRLEPGIDATYIVSGDSISKGVVYDETRSKYVILEDNYVSLLQGKLKGAVKNTARFGNTLIKGIGSLKKEILKDKPSMVLIEYGGNDCDFNWNEIASNPDAEHRPKTDFSLFEKMLTDTVNFLKSQSITPVLMSLPPLNADKYFKWVSRDNPEAEQNIMKFLGSVTKIYWWQERYNSTILKVSELTKTKYIDVRGAFLAHPDFTQFICSDGIHPNRDGHRIIYDKVLEFVKANYGHLLKDNTIGCEA